MDGVYLLIGTFFVIAVVLVTIILVLLKKHQYNQVRLQLDKLDKEKNIIASTPVYSELEKVESIVKNDKMEEKYKNWQKRFDVIKNEKINDINDMINELDLAINMKDYNTFNKNLPKVEMEVYKVKESADKLLSEIKEITISDEKYRSIVTKLKAKYRSLLSEFNSHKDDYEDVAEPIELQFETIEKRFQEFENCMDSNEYDEVSHIIKALDTMIDHMEVVVSEVPNLVLLAKKLIPKRVEEILLSNDELTGSGYNLSYLNISNNMEECNKNVNTIYDRIRVLNLDDCMFELKTLLDYLDSILDDIEKERLAKKLYDEHIVDFSSKLKSNNNIVKDIYKQLDSIKSLYDLNDEDLVDLQNIKLRLESIKKDYQKLVKQEEGSKQPYTYLSNELDNLDIMLSELESNLNESLNSLGSMHEDEARAREQLDEIRKLLKQCKLTIRSYKLPIIMNNYFVELSEANDAIEEISKELEKKPIVISTLNTRVDNGRDLVLKLYHTTMNMIKLAQLAEMTILYGNRYRSSNDNIDRGLDTAERLYHKGNYKEALDASIQAIEIVDKSFRSKISKLYE